MFHYGKSPDADEQHREVIKREDFRGNLHHHKRRLRKLVSSCRLERCPTSSKSVIDDIRTTTAGPRFSPYLESVRLHIAQQTLDPSGEFPR